MCYSLQNWKNDEKKKNFTPFMQFSPLFPGFGLAKSPLVAKLAKENKKGCAQSMWQSYLEGRDDSS
jgi:hypothetical protein